jgi:hypothetical protein
VAIKLEFSTVLDGGRMYLCNAVHEINPLLPQSAPAYQRGGMPSRGMNQVNGPLDDSLVFTNPHMHLDDHFASLFVTVDTSDSDLH